MTKEEVLQIAAKRLGWETCARTEPEGMERYYKPGMSPEDVVNEWWKEYYAEMIEKDKYWEEWM